MVKARTSKSGREPGDPVGALTPYGRATTRSASDPPALHPTENIALLEAVLDPANMNRAWQRVRSNKGAPGMDGVDIDSFPDWMRLHWPDIRRAILQGTYRPSPVRRVEIPKASGGKRKLGIPTVMDRVIQQAMLQMLSPMWEPEFSDSSFGFRPKRSAQGAVRQVRAIIKEGRRWAVDIDLRKFFDTVDHKIVLGRLARKLSGDPVLRLIAGYLRAGVEVDGDIQPSEQGVPQGGPLSPLLANIVLDDFDKELEQRGHRFARYADDFVVLVKSKKAGERVMAGITTYLERRLKLTVNQEKSQLVPTGELEFLGFDFRQGRIRISRGSLVTFKQRLKRYTCRHWFVSMEYRLAKLCRYVRGWMNYYGISEVYRIWPELDTWLRRRVRLCFWVMWRRPYPRIKQLIKLGVSIKQAVGLGRSSLGPWKCSRLLGFAMSPKWLEEQGLINLADDWWRCAHLR